MSHLTRKRSWRLLGEARGAEQPAIMAPPRRNGRATKRREAGSAARRRRHPACAPRGRHAAARDPEPIAQYVRNIEQDNEERLECKICLDSAAGRPLPEVRPLLRLHGLL